MIEMAENFEDRFFKLLQDNYNSLVKKVDNGFRDTNKKIDGNTKTTDQIKTRVDKLDGKVFGKKQGSMSNLIQDRQIIFAFGFALLVFLLILASVLHVKVPSL